MTTQPLEKDIQNDIRLQVSKKRPKTKLFRNNVGVAFFGVKMEIKGVGEVLTKLSRVVYGLFVGSSDLIGWTETTITPDMVGKKVAVFTSLEVKRPKKRPTKEQEDWLWAVRKAGGIAHRVDNAEQAIDVIDMGPDVVLSGGYEAKS